MQYKFILAKGQGLYMTTSSVGVGWLPRKGNQLCIQHS